MRLTVTQLRNARACLPALENFQNLFGDSVDVTEALAEQHRDDFSFEWALFHLCGISDDQLQAYLEQEFPDIGQHDNELFASCSRCNWLSTADNGDRFLKVVARFFAQQYNAKMSKGEI